MKENDLDVYPDISTKKAHDTAVYSTSRELELNDSEYDIGVFRECVRKLIADKERNPGTYVLFVNDCRTTQFDIIKEAAAASHVGFLGGLIRVAPNLKISGRVFANRTTPLAWETFDLDESRRDGKVTLLSHKGYLGTKDGNTLYGDAQAVTNSELWTLEKNDDGTVSLKSNSGYLCAENGSGWFCTANRSVIGPWEKFDLTRLGNGKIQLKTSGSVGRYVTVEE